MECGSPEAEVKEQRDIECEINQLKEVIDAYDGIKANILGFKNLVE